MILGCMVCGGLIEGALLVLGLGALVRWFKKRHNKKHCKEDKPE